MNREEIARVCHEVNRAYCQALGDFSQPKWEDAPDWQKQSALNGVDLHLANPTAGPQASHESWMKEKLDAGWVYGPVKDPDTKQHPCLVLFRDLPVEQQAKDFIFRSVVHALKGPERKFDCYNNAFPGEPNFTLLARDVAAPAAIRFWCDTRLRMGRNARMDEQIIDAQALAASMEAWERPPVE